MKERYRDGMAICVLSIIGVCVGICLGAVYQWLCIGAVSGTVLDRLLCAVGFGKQQ